MDHQFKAEAAREAFIALLSGHQKTVTFDWESASSRNLYHETWTILRHETLTVSGKPVDTIVFSRTKHAKRGGGWFNSTRWLTVKNGLWIKNELGLHNGGLSGGVAPTFTDVSVTFPQ